MQYQVFLYLASLVGVLELLSIIYLVSHFDNKRIRWFLAILVLNLGWLAFNALELLAGTEQWTLIFMKTAYCFLILLPPTWFLFTYIYIGYEYRRWMNLLYLIPGLNILFMLLNDGSHLFWSETIFTPVGNYLSVNNLYGPLFLEHAIISYVFLLAGLVVIIAHYNTIARLHRKSALIVIVAMSFCFLYNFSYLMGYLPFTKDFSSIAFGVSLLGIIYMITVRGMFELAIVPRQELFDYVENGMIVFNETGGILDVNPSAIALLDGGVKISDVLGKQAKDMFPFWKELTQFNGGVEEQTDGSNKSQLVVSTVEGELNYYDVSITPLRSAYLLILHDVTELQKLMIRVEELANFDSLTKLRNRRSFFNTVNILIKYSTRNHQSVSIILIDIDNFKMINDRNGHLAGDIVLKDVAEILEQTLRAVDVKARYGGDEFIVLLPQTKMEEAKIVAQKLMDQIKNHRFTKGTQEIKVTLSLGISGRNLVNQDFEIMRVIEEADAALYQAKKTGKDRILIHNSFIEENDLEISG